MAYAEYAQRQPTTANDKQLGECVCWWAHNAHIRPGCSFHIEYAIPTIVVNFGTTTGLSEKHFYHVEIVVNFRINTYLFIFRVWLSIYIMAVAHQEKKNVCRLKRMCCRSVVESIDMRRQMARIPKPSQIDSWRYDECAFCVAHTHTHTP